MTAMPHSQASQRIGLCRDGLSPSARGRRPQSAKTLFWHWLSNTLAMSPLAHHARPHRLSTPQPSCSTSHSRSASPDCRHNTHRVGSQRLRVFCCGTNDSAPPQNSKPLALPVATKYRPDVAACTSRAATSHFCNHNSTRIRALFSPTLREARFHCTARCAPSR